MQSIQLLMKQKETLKEDIIKCGSDFEATMTDGNHTGSMSNNLSFDLRENTKGRDLFAPEVLFTEIIEALALRNDTARHTREDLVSHETIHIKDNFMMRTVQFPPSAGSTSGGHMVEPLTSPPPQSVPLSSTYILGDVPDLLGSAPASPTMLELSPALQSNVTTLVVHNIPPKMSQESLLQLWHPSCGYDFLHVPYSTKQRRSVGYAFINSISNDAGILFYTRWVGQEVSFDGRSSKLCINASAVQGVQANMRK